MGDRDGGGCPHLFQSMVRFDRVMGDAAYDRRHRNQARGVTKTQQSTMAAGKGKQGDGWHDDGKGLHDDGKRQQGDGKRQQGDRRRRRGDCKAKARRRRGKKDVKAIGYGATGGRDNEAINKRKQIIDKFYQIIIRLIFFASFPHDTKVTSTTNEMAIRTRC